MFFSITMQVLDIDYFLFILFRVGLATIVLVLSVRESLGVIMSFLWNS